MRRLAAAALASLALLACEDQSYRDIGGEINILTKRNDALVAPATVRLSAYGRHAIPQIETALHAASENGRLHLLSALELIGDPEVIPILRHFALFDVSPSVRDAAESVLKDWVTGNNPRAETARQALARVADRRAKGDGPLLPRPSRAP